MTEDDSESSKAREVTEKCQSSAACGFIYMLDGTRAAEEAAQVPLIQLQMCSVICK